MIVEVQVRKCGQAAAVVGGTDVYSGEEHRARAAAAALRLLPDTTPMRECVRAARAAAMAAAGRPGMYGGAE